MAVEKLECALEVGKYYKKPTMSIEKLTKQIFDECEKDGEPVTMEEAKEMAEMEIKAKSNGRHYEKSLESTTKKNKKARPPRKIDETKKELLKIVKEAFTRNKIEITAEKTETEISFNYNNESYTLKLTKHRKK